MNFNPDWKTAQEFVCTSSSRAAWGAVLTHHLPSEQPISRAPAGDHTNYTQGADEFKVTELSGLPETQALALNISGPKLALPLVREQFLG